MQKISLKILPMLVVVSMLFGACAALPSMTFTASPVPSAISAVSATPTPSATSIPGVTSTAVGTSIPPQSDDVWDRIVANNKIVVGVDWSYPPFASVDTNFQVVGFDIALIEEIGRRLNIPVEINNYTFDGLPNALKTNQIDLAVAAMSITPERAGQMSFSPIYYVNQTAILARGGSKIRITDFEQLAGYRVGVRRGSVYEEMAQTRLVDAKLMSADKLFSYMQVDEAVRDLLENRVDVVLTGQATVRYYSAQADLQLVGKGFDQQDLAVAMRLETPRLKAEIDRVMDDMLTDGTILSLIQQYIQTDLSGVLPTPSPTNQPLATATRPIPTATPLACLDNMKFVADITYGDNNMKNPPFVQPGNGFVKIWRVQNTGSCTWTSSYKLTYAYGNVAAAQMSGQPLNMRQSVAPGQVVDLDITLISPKEPFTYQGFWQMENANGQRFGQTIWVGITTLIDPENPVATGQPSGNYCTVTNNAPTAYIFINSAFDAIWTVKNISGQDWSTDSVDYRYVSGAKMHEQPRYDLPQTIKNRESARIVVDMVAPAIPGIYHTKWAIVAGHNTLCILYVTVSVIEK